MSISEKAKEKLDEAGKEIKDAVDNLKKEVGELTEKVKDKLKGTGKETREATEELAKEVFICWSVLMVHFKGVFTFPVMWNQKR